MSAAMSYRILLLGSFLLLCGHSIESRVLAEIESNQTQLALATAFLSQLELYQRQHHYGQYSRLLESVEPRLVRSQSDQQCLQLLQFALHNPLSHRWTAKLLDSNGALFAPGLLSGTYISFGDFDSCLTVDGEYVDQGSTRQIRGKHCWATVRLPGDALRQIDYSYSSLLFQRNETWPDTLARRWTEVDVRFPIAQALCLPAVCSASFIRDVIRHAYQPLQKLDVNVEFCQTEESAAQKMFHWPISLIFIGTVLGLIFILTAFGTLLDVFATPPTDQLAEQRLSLRLLTSFSVVANTGDLFSLQRPAKFEWLDGIRCILCLLALFSHVSVNQSVLQLIQLPPFAHFPGDIVRQSSSLLNRYLVNSTFGIKTYFLMSGFLLSVNCLQRRRLHSFGRYLLSRWMRFTPALVGYISFSLVLSLIGSGPLFHVQLIDPYIRPCLSQLWMQLLYINNWFDFRYSCGFQTWYIAADLQLYLLAYSVLWLLCRQQWRNAKLACFFFIGLSYAISFVIFASGVQGIPYFLSVIFPQLPIAANGYLTYWTATYNHLEAYFAGILLGIVVARKVVIKLSESAIRQSWNGALLLLATLPLIFPWFMQSEHSKSLLDLLDSHSWLDALYMVAFHGSFILTVGWLFYCASTYPSRLKSNLALRFLSSPIFAPFSRLCYCVYLVHVPLTWFNVHSARYPQVRNEFGATQFVIMTYANSLAAAILLHLLFEAPFAKAAQLLFSWHDHRVKAKKAARTTDDSNKAVDVEVVLAMQAVH